MLEFSDIIKTVIKEQNLSIRKASFICGIHEVQFGKYVSGKNVPNFNTAVRIIEKLNWKLIPTINEFTCRSRESV